MGLAGRGLRGGWGRLCDGPSLGPPHALDRLPVCLPALALSAVVCLPPVEGLPLPVGLRAAPGYACVGPATMPASMRLPISAEGRPRMSARIASVSAPSKGAGAGSGRPEAEKAKGEAGTG